VSEQLVGSVDQVNVQVMALGGLDAILSSGIRKPGPAKASRTPEGLIAGVA
jgi:hypothetical protein